MPMQILKSKKILYLLLFGLILAISILINFNSPTLDGFIFSSLIIGLVFFGIIFLIIKFIQSIKNKNLRQSIVFLSSILILLIIIVFIYFYINSGLCMAVITPNHFRTNIFTGECDYGGGRADSCGPRDPWYYKKGCDSSQEKLVQVLKKSGLIQPPEDCINLCQTSTKEIFCSQIFRLGTEPSLEFRCDDFVECNRINCS